MAENDRGPAFAMTVHYHPDLSRDARELDVIVSVAASGLLGAADTLGGPTAEVIIVDTSGSMGDPAEKMRSARDATIAAINTVRDDVRFAVIGGTAAARMIYPRDRALVPATRLARDAAITAVGRLDANGGTAIGRWLDLANELFGDHDDTGARHAFLFTDGRNEHERPDELDATLARCRGRFVCDARGIGTNWVEAELHRIVSALNGRSDMVREYADAPADFRRVMRAAMNRVVPDVTLRVRTRGTAAVRLVKQVYPTVAEVTGQPVEPRLIDHYTGSWTDERRVYHLRLSVTHNNVPFGDPHMLPATVELVLGKPGAPIGRVPGVHLPGVRPIEIHWTRDAVRYSRIDAEVAHYTGQEELGEAVRNGCDALNNHDTAAAVRELGHAVRLAHSSGNQAQLDRLAALVAWDDPASGVVRLRTDFDAGAVRWAQSGSRISSYSGDDPDPAPEPVADAVDEPVDAVATDRPCPNCAFPCAPGAKFCERCGHAFDEVDK